MTAGATSRVDSPLAPTDGSRFRVTQAIDHCNVGWWSFVVGPYIRGKYRDSIAYLRRAFRLERPNDQFRRYCAAHFAALPREPAHHCQGLGGQIQGRPRGCTTPTSIGDAEHQASQSLSSDIADPRASLGGTGQQSNSTSHDSPCRRHAVSPRRHVDEGSVFRFDSCTRRVPVSNQVRGDGDPGACP